MRGYGILLTAYAAAFGLLAWSLPPAPLWTDTEYPDAASWATSGDGKTIASFNRTQRVGRLRVLDADTGLLRRNVVFDWHEREHDHYYVDPLSGVGSDAAFVVALNAEGTLAVVSGGARRATLVELGDEGFVRRYAARGDRRPTLGTAFLGADALLVHSGMSKGERTLAAWDFRQDKVRWQLRDCEVFALSGDGQRVATVETPRRRVFLRDANTGDEICECQGLPDWPAGPLRLAFAPDGRSLRVGSKAKSIDSYRDWEVDASSGKLLRGPLADSDEVGFSVYHNKLATVPRWRVAEGRRVPLPKGNPRCWTDDAGGELAHSRIEFFAPDEATPTHWFSRWSQYLHLEQWGAVVSQDGTRMGYENRDWRGVRRFEWHSVPGAADWWFAAGLALLPTALLGFVLWRRGGLRIGPTEEDLRT
jgi:hypothetical protein